MFTKEEIDSWNEIFPNCNIKQTDLSNPTESFLPKTLVSYLQMFGYDVQQRIEPENSKERRLFLIKLARHIDHILKITDKSYSFTYYDLLHPTPKKTSQMLGILLNYLYYFNMYKTEVFTKAGDRIKKREELIKRIQAIEHENRVQEDRADKIKNEIELFSEEVPIAQSQLAELKEIEKQKIEKIHELKVTFNDENHKLEQLNMQKRNLKKRIVLDSEAKEQYSQLKHLKEADNEVTKKKVSIESSLKEIADDMKYMSSMLKDIAETQKMLPQSQMDVLREVNNQVKNVKLCHNEKLQSKQELMLRIEKQQEEMQTLEKNMEALKNQWQIEKANQQQKFAEQKNEYNSIAAQHAHLEQELNTLSCQQQQQQDIYEYLRNAIENLFPLHR